MPIYNEAIIDKERRYHMDSATFLNTKAELGKLRRKGALTDDQFQFFKARVKNGGVSEKVLGLLNQAWELRCDDTLDDGEYAEGINMIISEVPASSAVDTPKITHASCLARMAALVVRCVHSYETVTRRCFAKKVHGYLPTWSAGSSEGTHPFFLFSARFGKSTGTRRGRLALTRPP